MLYSRSRKPQARPIVVHKLFRAGQGGLKELTKCPGLRPATLLNCDHAALGLAQPSPPKLKSATWLEHFELEQKRHACRRRAYCLQRTTREVDDNKGEILVAITLLVAGEQRYLHGMTLACIQWCCHYSGIGSRLSLHADYLRGS